MTHLRTLILSLLFVGFSSTAFGYSTIHGDTSEWVNEHRQLDEERLNEYKGLPAYNYNENPKHNINIISRLWNMFLDRLAEMLNVSDRALVKTLIYIIMGLAVAGLIYHLSGTQISGMLKKKSDSTLTGEVTLLDGESPIEKIDSGILHAENTDNFRLAIRLQFLKSIKLLDLAQLISWKPEATNYQLLNSIKKETIREEMVPLLDIYEHLWYGEYPVHDRSNYEGYKIHFDKFNTQISKTI